MAGKCGDCNLCCKWFGIPEMGKNGRDLCHNYSPSKKQCKVYDSRCATCKNYYCFWLVDYLPEWMKPNEINLLLDRFWIANDRLYMMGFTNKMTDEIDKICKNFKKIIYESQVDIDKGHFQFAKESGLIVDHLGNPCKINHSNFVRIPLIHA